MGINDDVKKDYEFKYYNSLSILDYKTNVLYKYYKNKLVPFGEFLPLEKMLSKLGLKTLTNNYQSYSASFERKIFDFGNYDKIKILPLICYEIIYSGKLSNNFDYNIIINISEDGWFGNSIGPYQHFAHTVFRSIEYGKYTLRSANNGISAIVDPSGAILEKININNEGVISIKQIKKVDKTLFSELGDKMYFLIILLYIFLIFLFMKLKNE
jgi:apolipoprotein N-acyltransferase